MQNSSGLKRVLLMPGYYDYQIHLGIVKFAREAGWELNSQMVHTQNIPAKWQGDGIISAMVDRMDIWEFIDEAKIPAVDWSYSDLGPQINRVLCDDFAIGRLGADYFLARGFKNLAFYEMLSKVSRQRMKGFLAKSPEESANFYVIKPDELRYFLKSSAKPLAIMCPQDTYAIDVMNECRRLGIKIPDEVAILGVDNDMFQCELAGVPLSSIDTNLQERGYQVAKLLDQLMKGEEVSEAPLLIPPVGVITRQSTDIYAVDHPKLAKALKYIKLNANSPVSPENIAENCLVSRRHLEDLFQKYLGKTIYEHLTKIRLKSAEELLKNTDRPIDFVAESCGFGSARTFRRVFKEHYQMSPRIYRKSFQG